MPPAQSVAQLLILAVSYGGLAIGYLPGLRMNRATIALVGAALLIGSGLLTVEQAWAAIDPTTIVFLLSNRPTRPSGLSKSETPNPQPQSCLKVKLMH